MLDDSLLADNPLVDEILAGLSKPNKTLPTKLFYDVEGCRLFGRITTLPEYYVTRSEVALLRSVAPKLPLLIGGVIVEYGGSDESKALPILDQIGATAYLPIDIADEALQDVRERLAVSRPKLTVYPIATDFLLPFTLPNFTLHLAKFGFFPGSTVGNLDPHAAVTFLKGARLTLGQGARFLVGVDLKKDPSILIPAYNDAQGVTAAFNLNMLAHVNRVAGSMFDISAFDHRAIWNDTQSRIEMHLVSRRSQTVQVAGQSIRFASGETIHTENSYKHTVDGFIDIAGLAGWSSESVWTDELFSLHLLQATETVE